MHAWQRFRGGGVDGANQCMRMWASHVRRPEHAWNLDVRGVIRATGDLEWAFDPIFRFGEHRRVRGRHVSSPAGTTRSPAPSSAGVLPNVLRLSEQCRCDVQTRGPGGLRRATCGQDRFRGCGLTMGVGVAAVTNRPAPRCTIT